MYGGKTAAPSGGSFWNVNSNVLFRQLKLLSISGHWLLMDAMGIGLCVAFITFVRLPSLKVSTVLLSSLLLYDVFWVFFSKYVFSANVMVRVATRPAANPMSAMARRLHLNRPPKLSLPGKLVFPSNQNHGHFSMLGLGDIVMPGLLLCFVMRYDAYKRAQVSFEKYRAPSINTVVPELLIPGTPNSRIS